MKKKTPEINDLHLPNTQTAYHPRQLAPVMVLLQAFC